VAEVTVKLALTPLNVTAVAPVRFVPLIVTLVPTSPLVGAKLVIVGALTTVNAPVLVAMPPGVVTLNGPVVAPGTVAWIAVATTGHENDPRLSKRNASALPRKRETTAVPRFRSAR